jgi:hypothetical protein
MNYKEQLPSGVYEYALCKFRYELELLMYPSLHVLPISVEGELELQRMCDEDNIGAYGISQINFEYDGDLFLAVLCNND